MKMSHNLSYLDKNCTPVNMRLNAPRAQTQLRTPLKSYQGNSFSCKYSYAAK